MVKQFLFKVICAFILSVNMYVANSQEWPTDKIAISLSYDDALHSQLDHVVPALNKHDFKASFYVIPTSNAFRSRLKEWRIIAHQGHELGNHTLIHSCRGSLENRQWVEPDKDLDKQSVARVVNEIHIANTLLEALDGKTQRTFTIPCGDELAGGVSSLHVPVGDSGDDLINYVKNQSEKVALINILFHGVGGDHLSVSKKAHDDLLIFLANNEDKYWVDTYLTIMNTLKKSEKIKLETSR